MPIPAETLNALLVTQDIHTGVFLSHARRVAIVVKIDKEGRVFFLHLTGDCKVVLEQSFREKFKADFPVELYHYPVARALRKYVSYVRKDKFEVADDARKVINAILAR